MNPLEFNLYTSIYGQRCAKKVAIIIENMTKNSGMTEEERLEIFISANNRFLGTIFLLPLDQDEVQRNKDKLRREIITEYEELPEQTLLSLLEFPMMIPYTIKYDGLKKRVSETIDKYLWQPWEYIQILEPNGESLIRERSIIIPFDMTREKIMGDLCMFPIIL